MKHLIILLAILATTGCTSTTAFKQKENTQYGEITFYRTTELQGSVTDTYVGWNGNYFYTLASGENLTTKVPAGFINLNVKAKVDVANELSLEVRPNQSYCVNVEVNPENIILVNWFVPGYQLKSIPCPNHKDS